MRPNPSRSRSLVRTAEFVSLSLLLAAPARAALTKHKDWGGSPEAYFLTKAERTTWSSIDSDEKAEIFVSAYRAARGGGFAAAIKSRIEYADKAFKLGKKRGSETLRGKALIVLGPPTRVDIVAASGAKEKADPTSGEVGNTGGGDRGGGSVGNLHTNVGGAGADSMRGMKAVSRSETTRWVYEKSAVPPALKLDDLKLEFTVEPDGGKETAKDAENLNEMIDAVVEYWGPKKK